MQTPETLPWWLYCCCWRSVTPPVASKALTRFFLDCLQVSLSQWLTHSLGDKYYGPMSLVLKIIDLLIANNPQLRWVFIKESRIWKNCYVSHQPLQSSKVFRNVSALRAPLHFRACPPQLSWKRKRNYGFCTNRQSTMYDAKLSCFLQRFSTGARPLLITTHTTDHHNIMVYAWRA